MQTELLHRCKQAVNAYRRAHSRDCSSQKSLDKPVVSSTGKHRSKLRCIIETRFEHRPCIIIQSAGNAQIKLHILVRNAERVKGIAEDLQFVNRLFCRINILKQSAQ